MAVIAIATSTEKNKATIGISKVPRPNPEKKVSRDARKLTTTMMIKLSIF
ncbi:hypothetical protein GCM10011501_28920 [Thalassotalea profundi]|uniref:Uncharacterized protein n=1 Tax=Thalassotalea profundi TaxID=2036687 RepID=A0ABQ3J108_9GAMM|nr:hypothetical protein GCM10011501_28920 [Thalassotalea profundi]